MKLWIALLAMFAATSVTLTAQDERPITGLEATFDQDHFADFSREGLMANRNYNVALRATLFGAWANSDYLGVPFVRKVIDYHWTKPLLRQLRFRLEETKHDFSFIANGFSPSYISDATDSFVFDVFNGYDLANDRPFSSFTGFRSTRRYEGNKLYPKSARQLDFAVNSSFTFGFAGLGLINAMQQYFHGNDSFGTSRPVPTLWDRDSAKEYPTGQVLPAGFPLIMYSLSAEAIAWRPHKLFQLQFRPEVNLGYYTNIGFGFDLGKLMSGDRYIDDLGYTDTNNAAALLIAKKHLAFSFVMGGTLRLVLYNAHLNGVFSWSDRHHVSFKDTRKVVLESYAGLRVQLFKIVEMMASFTARSSEFNNPIHPIQVWGTVSGKILINYQ